MALFRVEYDFPQGHGARLWVLPELCDDGEGHNGDFGANKSGLYTGKGVAYDFIALNADGSSRMLKSIAVAVEAKLEEDGTPRKWTVATSPVDIAFWERK